MSRETDMVRRLAVNDAIADAGTKTRHAAVLAVLYACDASPDVLPAYIESYSWAESTTFVYLLAKSGTSENYLGFGSERLRFVTGGMQLIRSPREHARWQAERLLSGLALMSPVTGFATEGEAEAHAVKMTALLGDHHGR